MYTPVYRELGNDSSPIVGLILSTLAFDRYMADLLPDKVSGIYAVLVNSCGDSHTCELTGSRAIYLGSGELYEQAYANLEVTVPFSAYKRPAAASSIEGHCLFQLRLYPGSSFVEGYRTNQPTIFATAIAVTFFLMAMTFLIYDRFVNRRNAKVVNAAARSNAIVSSLFPSNVRDRIYEEAEEKNKAAKNSSMLAPQSRLKDFLNNGGFDAEVLEDEDDIAVFKTKPIAELFPETTIMFADIAGFTAWSSSREPAQVFMLLETLYHAFDDIAKKRRVFKVETVGDCYVAVSGLPDPRKDHAVVMARFAKDCMHRMHFLTKRLEVSLGPDTAELSLRIGLHSGPVTAGVLRGERSRFQLFGDTMNTASRLESTGLRDRIQISQDTANILIRAGKAEWFKPRDDVVVAKGKGEIKTYWLSVGEKGNGTSATESTHNSEDGGFNSLAQTLGGSDIDGTGSGHQIYRLASEKATRLIDWNVDILARLLKQKMASRKMSVFRSGAVHSSVHEANIVGTVLDEVKEVINLPAFDIRSVKHQQDPDAIELEPAVMCQLREYVSNVAAMYKDNSFHNFEHASHITMSVVKLLSRIVAPADVVVQNEGQKKAIFASKLHDHTYGITSDPLTQFACVFSALIHDIDHSGVSNTQLIKEGSKIATFYKNKSVAEQNSVDLAWDLLMDSTFEDLRNLIYSTQDEKDRFRQLVVNSVMATDIMDKDLKQLRNARWEKAFSLDHVEENSRENTNRKATIVIEHLIQASDVAHTMQHWHIYRKWNEKLFVEMYNAFENGRADKNPADFWYKGELGFFDFYIIPLAKKLKDCGVFGVSSDEYLNYAMRNRQEWEDRGQQVVREMMAAIGINRE
jgi:class 3 adenylate cyclase